MAKLTQDTRDVESPVVVRVQETDDGYRRTYTCRPTINGTAKRKTLGPTHTYPLEEARDWAREFARYAKEGKDYGEVLAAETAAEADRSSDTYGRIVTDYIEIYAKKMQKTWGQTEMHLRSRPWDDKPIASITKGEVAAELRRVARRSQSSATLKLRLLKKFWNWCDEMDLVPGPILANLKVESLGVKKKVRKRVYADSEIKALWYIDNAVGPLAAAYVKLVMLLGVRRNELLKMRKDELDDLEDPTLWTIPPERTKTARRRDHEERVYLVPIPQRAAEILKPLLKSEGDLVFPGPV